MHTCGRDPVLSLILTPSTREAHRLGGEWFALVHPVSWWQSQGPNYPWHHVDLTLLWPHGKGLLALRVVIGGEEPGAWVPGFP